METALVLKLGLETVLYPALVTGLVLLSASLAGGRAAAGAALAAGYVTGHWLAIGLPPMPPVETTQWLLPLAAAAGLVSLPASRRWNSWGMSALILAAVGVTVRPMWRFHWSLAESFLWVAFLAAALLLLWRIGSNAEGGDDRWAVVTLTLTAAVTAGLLALSATTLLAQLAAVTFSSLLVLCVVRLPGRRLARGWIPVAVVLLGALACNGYFYAQLSGWSAAALLVALPAAWASRLLPLARPWQQITAAAVAVLLVTAPAAGLAVHEFYSDSGPAYYDEF